MSEQTPLQWLKPKNDFVFKLLFGSEDETSNQLLLAFLNDVLDVPEGQSLVKS
ncbi:PD-(D/E)XK nuclease family transposase [Halalkalibacter alkaliphilus]|uniref:PD-(D/E)XK nuclease family transposase n=1 Tax=Halalkalibacter alkaliphilus TaxID=2917993 RepID=UPI0023DFAFF0|nr:PD-(D/E)XK nuclease family transposase [Halalkalibacter alkaliphilus]